MQERLSVGNAKLLHVVGGLPHVHYFPTEGDEKLIEDENERPKKDMRKLCSNIALLVLLILLAALAAYLVWPLPRQEDDDTVEIPVSEKFLINYRGLAKFQPVSSESEATNRFSAEMIPKIDDNADMQMQGDTSDSENQSNVPTKADVEEVAFEIHSAIHRLETPMNDWVEESKLNLPERETDLKKPLPADSSEVYMALIVALSKIIEDVRAPVKTPDGVFFGEKDFETGVPASDETMDSYPDSYNGSTNIEENDDFSYGDPEIPMEYHRKK